MKIINSYGSGTPEATNFVQGQLAIDSSDGAIYVKKDDGTMPKAKTDVVDLGGITQNFSIDINVDCSKRNVVVALNSDANVTWANVPTGYYTMTIIKQNAGGINLNNFNIMWEGGVQPVWSIETDIITLSTLNQGSSWFGSSTLGYI